MRLINLPVSPFAARVRIAIYAKDLDIELVAPPPGWPKAHASMGPLGRVPVLICDDGLILESQVILEYLEEIFPDAPPLLPRTPEERAHVRLIARVVDLYLMPPLVSLANDRNDEGRRRSLIRATSEALSVVDDLIEANPYAAGESLTLADCALVPALFAARVTGERHGFAVLTPHETLKRYAAAVEQHKDTGRVLLEMTEGLRELEQGSPRAE
jgi:glutathione S-transferase